MTREEIVMDALTNYISELILCKVRIHNVMCDKDLHLDDKYVLQLKDDLNEHERNIEKAQMMLDEIERHMSDNDGWVLNKE